MTKLFKNKYRIESTRLQNWDYGWGAAYFITICTADRKHFFGEIKNGKMILSEIGKIAEKEWLKIFELRKDMNLTQEAFVVMPDHFHAIIRIGKNEYNSRKQESSQSKNISSTVSIHRDSKAEMHKDSKAEMHKDLESSQSKNKFGPQSKNLASIMRGFKSAVTIQARRINSKFAWQSKFHDHIIRDSIAFYRIEQYIINNPRKWQEDKLHKNT